MLLKVSKGEANWICSSKVDPISDIQLALMVAVLDHHSQLNVFKESNEQHRIYVNYYPLMPLSKWSDVMSSLALDTVNFSRSLKTRSRRRLWETVSEALQKSK